MVWVKLGSVTRNLTDGTGEIFMMKNSFLHPQFRPGSKIHDIALIELDRIVKFSSNQRPICLNTNYTANYDPVTAIGWGNTAGMYSYFSLNIVLSRFEPFEIQN